MSGGKSSGSQSQSGKSNSTFNNTGTSSSTSPFAGWLGNFGSAFSSEAQDVIGPWIQQLNSALSGNYTAGTIPLVNNAVSAERGAGAQSYNQAKANLSQTGAARSPFAATALSGVESSANEAIGKAPTDTIMGLISQIPQAASTIGGLGISGLSDAARAFMQTVTSGSGSSAGTSSGSGVASSKGGGFDTGGLGDLAALFGA